MQQFFLLILVLLFVQEGFSSWAAQPAVIAGVVSTKDKKGLRLRSCPNTNCPISGALKEGKTYYFENKMHGEWYRIFNQYAHGDYVKVDLGYTTQAKASRRSFNENVLKEAIDKALNEKFFNVKPISDSGKTIDSLTLERATDFVQVYSFLLYGRRHYGVYDMLSENSGLLHFTDGKMGYCLLASSGRSVEKSHGFSYDLMTKDIVGSINVKLKKTYSLDQFPYKHKGYSFFGNICAIDFFDKKTEQDVLNKDIYVRDLGRILKSRKSFLIDEIDKVSSFENKNLVDKSKNEIEKYAPLFTSQLKAAYFYNINRYQNRVFAYYDSAKKENQMKISGLIKDLDLNIKYKSFVIKFDANTSGPRGMQYKGAIYAQEDMEINQIKIYKGEYVDLNELVKILYVGSKYPKLKANVEFGFARTIDQKNFSDLKGLFFDLKNINIKSKLYAISPHYISFYDDDHGTLGLEPRTFSVTEEVRATNSKYFGANKFMNQRIDFVVGYSPSANEKPLGCVTTNINYVNLEKEILALGLSEDQIIKIRGNEVEISKPLDIYGLIQLAPHSKLILNISDCMKTIFLYQAMAQPGSRWQGRVLESETQVFFEKDKVVRILDKDGEKAVYSKYTTNINVGFKQGVTKYPLCILNKLAKYSPLERLVLEPCDYAFSEVKLHEIEQIDAEKGTITIQGRTYRTKDITSKLTARIDEQEFWLPFVPDLNTLKYKDRIHNIIREYYVFPSAWVGSDTKLSGRADYCGDKYVGCEPDSQQSEGQQIRTMDFEAFKNKTIMLKLYESIPDPSNFCEGFC